MIIRNISCTLFTLKGITKSLAIYKLKHAGVFACPSKYPHYIWVNAAKIEQAKEILGE
jgi:hypothetical protein